VVPLDTTVKNE
jgi:hypothetical protein